VRLFADDTMIYLAVKSEQDSKAFQKDIDELAAWGNMDDGVPHRQMWSNKHKQEA